MSRVKSALTISDKFTEKIYELLHKYRDCASDETEEIEGEVFTEIKALIKDIERECQKKIKK